MDMPLLDEIDMEILMHRNTHFGGNFDIMIRYYEEDGIGINEEFDLDRIKLLKQSQDALGEDLSEKVLPTHCTEEIENAKNAYIKLRDVYDMEKVPKIVRLISDLILSESQDRAEEIEALVSLKKESINSLLQVISATDFYNPLFPGYGLAPIFAIKALEQINDPETIPHLFLALGQESVDAEDALICALHSFGTKARDFLTKRVQEKPYGADNEQAAAALASFTPDDEVEKVALKLLNENDVLAKEMFAAYLICLLAETTNQDSVAQLEKLSKKKDLPHSIQAECLNLLRSKNHK